MELMARVLAGVIAAWIPIDDETIGAGEEMRADAMRSPSVRGCDQCKDLRRIHAPQARAAALLRRQT